MDHPIYRVDVFAIVAPYVLRVEFDDRTQQIINFEPILAGELFGPLRDLTIFNQVRIDPEVHTLVWPNGADFDPATLHDWPEHLPELAARARQWQLAESSRQLQPHYQFVFRKGSQICIQLCWSPRSCH